MRTDFVPVEEFAYVRAEIVQAICDMPSCGRTALAVTASLSDAEYYRTNMRLGSVDLDPGNYNMTVNLYQADGSGRGFGGSDSFTIGDNGPSSALVFIPRTTESCETDDECPAPTACGASSCEDGTCWWSPIENPCIGEQYCSAVMGCSDPPDTEPFHCEDGDSCVPGGPCLVGQFQDCDSAPTCGELVYAEEGAYCWGENGAGICDAEGNCE